MINTVNSIPHFTTKRVLVISKKYSYYKHLGADIFGNLFLLPHCTNNRSVFLKQLKPFENGNKNAVNYKGSNISFKQLKECAYDCEEYYFMP